MHKDISFITIKTFFYGIVLKVVTGFRYLGGYIEDTEVWEIWLGYKMIDWEVVMKMLEGLELRHIHRAYTGMQNSLQQVWDFVQLIYPRVGKNSRWCGEALRRALLIALLHGEESHMLGQQFTRLPAKKSSLALPDPNISYP